MTAGREMFFSDVDSDEESPDLGLWAELLEPEDVVELQQLTAAARKKEKE